MAEAPDDQSCAVCRFYVDVVGECHRYPPLVAAPAIRSMGAWPAVSADAWCGEFGKIKEGPPAVPIEKE